MSIDDQDMDKRLHSAFKYEPEYLFYLLGSIGSGSTQPQSAGEATQLGKDFFARFQKQLKKAICSKGGPYDNFLRGLTAQKDLPKLMVLSILGSSPEIAAMAAAKMISIYLALIILKSGVGAYCEE